ncbi:hypothetical protein [Microbacterium sp. Leaf320]|uniref:hypothetical protein n=1 Tax=Microbacterium sp. Leaf320 TaxID=1736334 RepID=UPI000A97FE6B|nr:hypothetical protein [Microbacterium sp. Leaf320]
MTLRGKTLGAVCVIAALLLTSCAPVPTADEATPAPTPPFSESTISITYVQDGEQRELVAHPSKPLCDWDGYITVIGEDLVVPNGVMLSLEDGSESTITGWVGDDGVAANFRSSGDVSIVRGEESSVLFVSDLEGFADIAPREVGVAASIDTVIGEWERVDATLTFAVTCPNE